MKSYSRTSLIAFLLALSIAVGEGIVLFNLSQENRELRDAEKGHKGGKPEWADKLAKRDAELQVLRVQVQDLLRLRHEVRLLRSGTNELARLQEENRQLREHETNLTAAPAIVVAADGEEDPVLKENWTFAGYATPEATLQSWMWSLREADPDAFFESLSPDGRTRFETQMQQDNKTQDELIAQLKKDADDITAFQILEQTSTSEDVMVLSVRVTGAEITNHRFLFTRTGNEWKMSDAGIVQ